MQDNPFHLSEFLRFLSSGKVKVGERIPSLSQLSRSLGISIPTLREQLEVARIMGLVEVRPRTGIRLLPYQFKPAVLQSLYFSLSQNTETFVKFADLRTHIEMSYWYEAVGLLNNDDQQELRTLIRRAKEKLSADPPQIPHQEHRSLHLTIFKRLDNPFVQGILEAYWEVYEAIGMDVYTDFAYLERVWQYHEKMVDAIYKQNFNEGYEALVEHMDLIYQRSKRPSYHAFE